MLSTGASQFYLPPISSMPDSEQQERHKPRFDGTVNLGHIMTGLMMACGLLTMWTSMAEFKTSTSLRIANLEAAQLEQKKSNDEHVRALNEILRTQDKLTNALDSLNSRINRAP